MTCPAGVSRAYCRPNWQLREAELNNVHGINISLHLWSVIRLNRKIRATMVILPQITLPDEVGSMPSGA